jgi:peptidoglycan/LPS O-acetylase OafA/YrhL
MNTGTLQSTKPRLHGIESLRAYAAVAIILFHVIGIASLQIPEILNFIKYYFGFGVPLFFVVSAFSMAYGYWGSLHSEELIGNYFLRRFFRIAPLFYTMLFLQILMVRYVNGVSFNILDILLNATFLFNVIPHLTDGIVPASWSIGVEMLFYGLFPVILIFVKDFKRAVILLGLSVLMATYFSVQLAPFVDKIPSFAYHNFIVDFPYFCWGIVAFHIYAYLGKKSPANAGPWISRVLCVLGIACMVFLYKNSSLYMFFYGRGLRTTWDALWGVPFSMLCIGLSFHATRLLTNPVTEYLGKISFSLYLVHPNVVSYLGIWGVYKFMYDISPGSHGIGFAFSAVFTVVVVSIISWVTFKFIEQPGNAWGKRLTKRTVAV